jgi:hypothetical protein
MVERGWQYSDLMNMKLPTLFLYLEETTKRYNDLIKQQQEANG